jgi:ribosomal protein L19
MKPGDLVRVRIKNPNPTVSAFNGFTGIIIKSGARGP